MTTLSPTTCTERHGERALSALGAAAVVCVALFVLAGCAGKEAAPDRAEQSLTGGSDDTKSTRYEQTLDDPANLLSRPTGSLATDDAPEGGTLRRYLSTTPRGLNWLTENGADVQEIQSYAHDSFAIRDPSDPTRWIPQLAYKITVSEDGRTYTIHLRKGVFWQLPSVDYSDPRNDWLKQRRELTAKDAAFLFEMIQHPDTKAGAIKSYYNDLDRVEVIDRYTFKVVWKQKLAHAKEFTIGMYPMPKWLFTRDRSGEALDASKIASNLHDHWASPYAVGTGPYRVADIAKDEHVRLERNPTYWGPRPPISRIVYKVFPGPAHAYEAFGRGELDLVEIDPPKYRDAILEKRDQGALSDVEYEHRVVDRPVFYYLGWNADKPMFADKRVRQAMTHAMDREAMIEETLYGLGKQISGPALPDHPGNNPSIEPLSFDLDKARALLDAAGWTDSDGDGIRDKMIDGERRSFMFEMMAYNKKTARDYLDRFRTDLRKIGVVMSVQPTGWGQMQKQMDARQFDAFTGGWGLSWSQNPYQLWHSSQADVPRGSNRVGFRNAEADKIIETLRTTLDEDKRAELLREFHAIIHDEQPYTFLYQLRSAYAWRPTLKNVQFQPLRPMDFSVPWYFERDQADETQTVTEATPSQ
jgi:ABC-type transport system substrate-binding protein